MRYRTIVADPPWPHAARLMRATKQNGRTYSVGALPYDTMSVDEIKALPVRNLSQGDVWHVNGAKAGSELYLWTTTQFLVAAHDVARAWGFPPSAVLVWCKAPRGFDAGGTFSANVEFVVYGRRGSPTVTGGSRTRWFTWPRGAHSAKPEAFYDLVEQVSPGPYLELFARRNRLGWSTWGDQALEHVDLVSRRARQADA